MIQTSIKNKYCFNMLVSARAMAPLGTGAYREMREKWPATRSRTGYVSVGSRQCVFFRSAHRFSPPTSRTSRLAQIVRAIENVGVWQGHMQFRQLRYFVKIVEAGSFSRAASVV